MSGFIKLENGQRTTGVRMFFDELPKHIQPIQKAIPPYMPFEKGYGYMGVLLLDTETDRIQCHYCGLWFKSMSRHLEKIHGFNASHYKKEVGLYQKNA